MIGSMRLLNGSPRPASSVDLEALRGFAAAAEAVLRRALAAREPARAAAGAAEPA